MVSILASTAAAVVVKHRLYAIEEIVADQRLVPSTNQFTLVGDAADVIRVTKDLVER
jgi:hypothetical protein